MGKKIILLSTLLEHEMEHLHNEYPSKNKNHHNCPKILFYKALPMVRRKYLEHTFLHHDNQK